MSALRERIAAEIRSRGPIPFSRYMELCLYDPELGYYSRNAEQFGKAGDFYTSSDIHSVFGRLMARQFEEMWRSLGSPKDIAVVELGPGRGLFAQDVLAWSEKKFPEFFRSLNYVLVETSLALQRKIQHTLSRHLEAGRAAVHSEIPDSIRPYPAIFFANEFFDALPVEVVSAAGSLRIDIQNDKLNEAWVQSSPEELEFLDRYSVHPEPGERLEVPLVGQRYLRDIAEQLRHGFLIAIDYGYARNEQLAGRHRGTLKAIRRHSVSADPYEAPGEQDLTADVNFTALASAAEQCGLHAHKLLTQSQFLMGIGEPNQFVDVFEDARLPQERAKAALQLKHLVTPAGMGESFQVMVAARQVPNEKLERLAGLTFAK